MEIIQIDGERNYFLYYDSDEKKILYDQIKVSHLVCEVDGITFTVPKSHIKNGNPIGIYFIYQDTLYAVDDNCQDYLNFCGYLIRGNYDIIKQKSKEIGVTERDAIRDMIIDFCEESGHKYLINGNNVTVEVSTVDNVVNTLEFKTINNSVNSNKFRKEHGLLYYPYLKDVDKYNCFHVLGFSHPLEPTTLLPYAYENEFEKFMADLIGFSNKYDSIHQERFKFKVIRIKNRIIKWRELKPLEIKVERSLEEFSVI